MNPQAAEVWRANFIDITKDISSDITYKKSSEELSKLIRTKKLLFTDMRDDPEKFFEAHRLLLAPSTRGPGFGIRFTVQFNLFAGSILGLGSEEQVKVLDEYQENGTLGCFCLTEKFAGVNSGLIVGTTATWLPEKQMFNLHCPNEGSEKNWISQGLTASHAVVIANLIVEDRNHGPHGFLVNLNSYRNKIVFTDMGKKTTGNDLDNARIKFNNVEIPKSCLLNKFADIKNNKYFQPTDQKMRLEVIGQRLLSGRLAISQACLVFTQNLFKKTKEFAKSRRVWAPNNATSYLYELPQLKSLFDDAEERLGNMLKYSMLVEDQINETLKHGTIPSADLVEKIAVAKVVCIETSIRLCFELKQEVGSYGLMDDTGFEHLDFLQCCKFAEGDSRILCQKIARDSMKKFKKNPKGFNDEGVEKACGVLASSLASSKEKNFLTNWNNNYRHVYGLAAAVQDMHMKNLIGVSARL